MGDTGCAIVDIMTHMISERGLPPEAEGCGLNDVLVPIQIVM